MFWIWKNHKIKCNSSANNFNDFLVPQSPDSRMEFQMQQNLCKFILNSIKSLNNPQETFYGFIPGRQNVNFLFKFSKLIHYLLRWECDSRKRIFHWNVSKTAIISWKCAAVFLYVRVSVVYGFKIYFFSKIKTHNSYWSP